MKTNNKTYDMKTMFNRFNNIDYEIKAMLDHNEFYKREQSAEFKALRGRKQFQKIKIEFIDATASLEKYMNTPSAQVLFKYKCAKDNINLMEEKMKVIAGNSVEENINIILKYLSIFGSMHYIMSVLTKEEIVFFVNKKLSLVDIFGLKTKDLLNIYEAAYECSSLFNKDKVDAIVDKICDNAEIDMMHSYNAIKQNAHTRNYIKSRPYLTDEMKNSICKELETLEVLYLLKQS